MSGVAVARGTVHAYSTQTDVDLALAALVE